MHIKFLMIFSILSMFSFYSCVFPEHGSCNHSETIGSCDEYWKNPISEDICQAVGGKFFWEGCPRSSATHICESYDGKGNLLIRSYIYENYAGSEEYLIKKNCKKQGLIQ